MFKSQTQTLSQTHTIIYILLIITITISYKVSDFKPSILKPTHSSSYYNVDTGI